MGEYEHLHHTFEPVFDGKSRILILGTFPSVKSRENEFYYGHPQNRFWKVLAAVTGADTPVGTEEKIRFLKDSKISIWDVIDSCDIIGSSDSSIRNVVPADLSVILEKADIRQIYANGGKAWQLYQKYLLPAAGRSCIKLPSTSPANAAFSLERLKEEWSVIKEHLEENDMPGSFRIQP
ncbi:DNA-deoxyinosine glycosylase [Murimonas intestini]|uniref:G/U mismatch-specific uracil-DNA glycosylase n=1 Tax=Murimonas intestini TaxID=1337051 RepID=A0AB73SZ76_9FIRM|nr:DNA-deoxyinosine glycosylase [Murimonas intestini]MCR1842919.1 DNA-deoxyinosine glycosylase [Murimonas intestini]MCR1868118.1 DNA-deoxyinosine glycosylase [Murimonas intestini]MCR1885390.1 DNA-deoxyinosine glycosylase [Murimonas intestini]